MHFDIFFVGRIPMFYCVWDALYFSDLHACAFYGPLTLLIYCCSVKLQRFRKSRRPRLHKYNAIIAIDWSHESEENQGVIVKEKNKPTCMIHYAYANTFKDLGGLEDFTGY